MTDIHAANRKETESGRWFLYWATPLVGDDGGKLTAYRRLNKIVQQMPTPFWIGPLEIKAVGLNRRIGEAIRNLPVSGGYIFRMARRRAMLSSSG